MLSVISVCYLEQVDPSIIQDNLKEFKGARRRFSETIVDNSVIIDDYAHHPNEIKATIEAVRQKYKDKKIVCIFQPHTFSRTKEFADDFVKVLSEVDASYILDIHPAREKQEDFKDITSNIIIDKLDNGYSITKDNANCLLKHKGSVYIFMDPNDISSLEKDLENKLKER